MVLTAPNVHERIRASAKTTTRGGDHCLEFNAMASPCRVSFAGPAAVARAFFATALQWVADFEARYSRFLPDSLISRINDSAGTGWVETDAETDGIFALCDEAHFLTGGIFDPTALPLIQLWNWKAKPPVIPGDAEIQAALKNVGWRNVQRAPGKIFLPSAGMSLDLGGIGKEYAVDRVAQIAAQHGIASALVDFGQDVFTLGVPADGRPAWHIGLQDPQQPGRCWAGVAVKNQAVATSGDYFRRFEINGQRYGHILDVRTGRPAASGCRAVSVLAPTCTLAGLFATAAFVLGAEEGLKLLESTPNVAGCITLESRRVYTRRFYDYVVS